MWKYYSRESTTEKRLGGIHIWHHMRRKLSQIWGTATNNCGAFRLRGGAKNHKIICVDVTYGGPLYSDHSRRQQMLLHWEGNLSQVDNGLAVVAVFGRTPEIKHLSIILDSFHKFSESNIIPYLSNEELPSFIRASFKSPHKYYICFWEQIQTYSNQLLVVRILATHYNSREQRAIEFPNMTQQPIADKYCYLWMSI